MDYGRPRYEGKEVSLLLLEKKGDRQWSVIGNGQMQVPMSVMEKQTNKYVGLVINVNPVHAY